VSHSFRTVFNRGPTGLLPADLGPGGPCHPQTGQAHSAVLVARGRLCVMGTWVCRCSWSLSRLRRNGGDGVVTAAASTRAIAASDARLRATIATDDDAVAVTPAASERTVQTLAQVFDDIRRGAPPLMAFNEFLHEWFDYAKEQRSTLVAAPPASLDDAPPAPDTRSGGRWLWRWRVFCAAVAEELCAQVGLACPSWALDPRLTLDEPWYVVDDSIGQRPEMRRWLEDETPPALRRRKVYAGGRLFANKYAFAAQARAL